jgi:predicted HicB family RNase H-like nuclease
MFTYKGYTGHLEIDPDAGILFGRVLDIKDVITFQGETIEEARQAFEDSVDDYLEFCVELGQSPDKPFSGKLPFRTTPEIHRQITIAATTQGKSINSWMEDVLAQAAISTIK